MDDIADIVGTPLGGGSLWRVQPIRVPGLNLVVPAQSGRPRSPIAASTRTLCSPMDQTPLNTTLNITRNASTRTLCSPMDQ